jgi:hypothetical protein
MVDLVTAHIDSARLGCKNWCRGARQSAGKFLTVNVSQQNSRR